MNASNPGSSTVFSAVLTITTCAVLVDGCVVPRYGAKATFVDEIYTWMNNSNMEKLALRISDLRISDPPLNPRAP